MSGDNIDDMISNQMDEDIDSLVEYSKAISPQKYFQDDEMYTNERDRLFNQFLNVFTQNYQKTSKAKHRMKIFFFAFIMAVFIAFAAAPLVLLIFVVIKQLSSVSILVAVIASFAEFLGAIIILPKIIAEYLFNKQEEDSITQIIQTMQEYNKHSHERVDKNHTVKNK